MSLHLDNRTKAYTFIEQSHILGLWFSKTKTSYVNNIAWMECLSECECRIGWVRIMLCYKHLCCWFPLKTWELSIRLMLGSCKNDAIVGACGQHMVSISCLQNCELCKSWCRKGVVWGILGHSGWRTPVKYAGACDQCIQLDMENSNCWRIYSIQIYSQPKLWQSLKR